MSVGTGADGAAGSAGAAGPPVEALTRRLIDTPRDLLAEPVGAPDGQVVVAAVVSDVVRLHGGAGLDTVTAAPFRLPPVAAATPGAVNWLRCVLLGSWVLTDPGLVAAGRPDLVLAFLTTGLQELAATVPSATLVADPDRREELARRCVRALGLVPAGESEAQSSDRLATLDSAERARVLAATREAEQRAEEVRQAMHAAAAAEAAAKASRENERPAEVDVEVVGRRGGGRWRSRRGMGGMGGMGQMGVMGAGPTDEGLTEQQRRPLIDADGRRLLESLLEHRHAPRYNHTCGDRLTAERLAAVRELDARTRTSIGFRPGQPPSWVAAFVARVASTVPAYRRGPVPARFEDLPTIGRSELIADPYSFVPDDHPLDAMVVFTTTGTTDGRLAYIPSTPDATAAYSVMLRAALRLHGLTLEGGPGRTAVAQICWQRSTYTYASVSSFLDQAALLKLNLNPAEWRHPDDEIAFLDDVAPEVLTGDPVAFARLADLPVSIRPKALLSTAMALLPGLRARLEERFGCPAIDVYGMNEAGPIAAALPDGSGHGLLQPELYVEVLDADGRPCAEGVRGEITLTSGFNAAFPLLRYRTGDHAALRLRGSMPVLVGLEGRAPVPLQSADGRAVNTIDVTVALRRLPLARFTVHQRADRSLDVAVDTGRAGVRAPDPALTASIEAALADLFGAVAVTVGSLAGAPERVTYSSDLPST